MDTFGKKLYSQIYEDKDNLKFNEEGQHPLFDIDKRNRILIIGQAPGIKAMEKGRCWDDQSGKRLREWLGVTEDIFYNSGLIGIAPMDFYFPGHGKSGDLPPRKTFADKWHSLIIKYCTDVKLIILIGKYAQEYYLKDSIKLSLTRTVETYKEYLPKYFPIVHPSPRNQIWIKKNPWYQEKVLPDLKEEVSKVLKYKEK